MSLRIVILPAPVVAEPAVALPDNPHASRARGIAGALGPYLDGAVTRAMASPPIWLGPYAQATTQTLLQRQKTFRQMASDLLSDAARREAEARRLEDEAARAAAASRAGGR